MLRRKYFLLALVILALLGPQAWWAYHHRAVNPEQIDTPAEGWSASAPSSPQTMLAKPEPVKIPLPSGQIGRIPILMYHEISSGPDCMWVDTADFREQMSYLAERGIQTITLSQATILLSGHYDTSNMVVLTFDDGYDTFYNHAWPVLRDLNQTATVFVISGMVGNPEYMNWDQVKFLASQGIEIGGHTITHPLLPNIQASEARLEIIQDKKDIEAHLGQPITSFCYPTGKYNGPILGMVKEAGYTGAVTMVQAEASSADSLLLLPRWGIYQDDPLARFAKLVQ